MTAGPFEEEAALVRVGEARARGARVVFTNGAFDLLHPGHVRALEAARALGDLLVVGVNGDASVRRAKGADRPVFRAVDRATVVAALASVDVVLVFDDDTVDRLLDRLRPDVHAKGGDYDEATLPERETARRLGIEVAFVGGPKTHSTTRIVQRLGPPRSSDGLAGRPDVLANLAAAGVGTVSEALAASTCVRDLPDRSNHRLAVGGRTFFLKREKRRRARGGRPAEAAGIDAVAAAGVPTAPVAFEGVDPELGGLTATADLAPARPLDDLLAAGAVDPGARRRLLGAVVRTVAALHAAGLDHRDLYLAHLFADPDRPDRVWLVDCDRVGRHVRALGRRVVKDLAALCASAPDAAVSESERTRFLLAYLARRGLPRSAWPRLVRRVRAKARRIRAHVPRTPVGEAARP